VWGEKNLEPSVWGWAALVRQIGRTEICWAFLFLFIILIYIYIDIYTERNVYLPLQFIYKAEKVLQKNELVI
jgi:hypothetical protein